MCVCMHILTEGAEVKGGCLPQILSIFRDRVSHEIQFAIQLDGVQQVPGIRLSELGLRCPAVYRVFRVRTWVLVLIHREFSDWAVSPNSALWFLMAFS